MDKQRYAKSYTDARMGKVVIEIRIKWLYLIFDFLKTMSKYPNPGLNKFWVHDNSL